MERVGLVTFHSPINYGARFQAFALQEAVRKLGAECRIIDYLPPSAAVSSLSLPRRCYRTLTKKRFSKRIHCLENGFEEWTSSNLSLSKPLCTESDLRKESEKYDVFICGSDQIWRVPQRGFYFLDFSPSASRRIAYAPSFGKIDFNSDDKTLIKRLLEDFEAISVREKEGADFLTKLLGRPVPAVLDPTLLWGKDFWQSRSVSPRFRLPEHFALVFSVQDTIPAFKAAKKICKDLGLEPVLVDTAMRLVWHPFLNNFFDASPAEFISLVDLADFIITTSFHGTAFAVNFRKPFVTICHTGSENVNSRIVSLADIIGVRDRIFCAGDKISESVYCGLGPEVGLRLASERRRSLDFLADALKKPIHR